jgi:type II secretory pathway pseudopilin PulG
MISRKANVGNSRQRASGFSLVELLVVVVIGIILVAVSSMTMMPLMQQQHVTNAYNTTLAAMRQARDNAVAQALPYKVTFSNAAIPNTVVVAPDFSTISNASTTTLSLPTLNFQLPLDVAFVASGLPTVPPDAVNSAGYGTGVVPIDFGYTSSGGTGGQQTIWFCPDGSAQTTASCYGSGNWDGGVVYIDGPVTVNNGTATVSNMLNYRALTLWGATGRIHGWRLYSKSGGGYQWVRQ